MDKYRWRLPSLLLILAFCHSCKTEPKPPAEVTRACYFWRHDYATAGEVEFLKTHQVQKLYARVLDVDWNDVQGAIPVASADIHRLDYYLRRIDSLNLNTVPVVFLTNEVFEKIPENDIPLLAKRVIRRCLPSYDSTDQHYEKKYFLNEIAVHPREIQFDCDWTTGTSKKYFSFLKAVKALLPSDSIQLSATVRLHQYKYPSKTGVPPVDRGMLMVYNISDPKQYQKTNSIFDYDKARAYFNDTKEYELPLDIALPAFSWCLIFRQHQFYQIENGLTENELRGKDFVEDSGNGFYRVTRDTVFRDIFLRPGDEIKAETVRSADLQAASQLAQKAVNSNRYSVALFELSENEIKNYSRETIDQIYRSYR